jgi:hypothetical protein
MSRVHRYRSLLLSLCTFVLVLLAGVNVASGLHRHHAPFAQGIGASAQITMSDHAVVHAAPDDVADDASSGSSSFGDDSDLDDQLVVPELAHVAPRSLNDGVLVGTTPSVQLAPFAELLRPPRAA